ncbi:ComF family protein [Borreliella burgdorferi]|uniref:Competence protein F, putative n=4 Tax=Borreliella burgdorferi TaxID=139 RepID=O51738_BORBU|nr:ComF family protein [Borreliella burgdorferi]AAC67156.1 competence protein F, putative [Borreliella burgdorferi B31]ACK74619.1 putative competence protein F [Borreliella burgdorferi ZS7]ADQ29771.1 competence protein F, putative [Borreliella burgdorferi N40]ADQ31194.1 competence protein F, putative [Borreliella burgdorferi JD1]ARS30531.1 amidophosphoribosyltransferase [Borreliella burgdorferi]
MSYLNVLKSIFLPFCVFCGKRYVSSNALCDQCKSLFNFNIKFDENLIYFFEYKEHYKSLILSYKRDAQKSIGRFLASGIAECLNNIDFDQIVTVPCSFKRKLFYGFDHMEYIGILLSRFGFNYINIFSRKYGKSQKLMKGNLRFKNLENKIKLRSKYKNFQFKKIVLLDDIVTTGASMCICEDLIMQLGAYKVIKLSLAKSYNLV